MDDSIKIISSTSTPEYRDILATYDINKYMSKNLMTIYEKTNIIGVRLEQLSFGAPSTLTEEETRKINDIRLIAREELRQKKIPFIICRQLPNNVKEYWKVENLIII